MRTPASIGSHPIHPMLIPFPFALWFFSLAADLIYLWRGNPIWRDWIAFYTLGAGIISFGRDAKGIGSELLKLPSAIRNLRFAKVIQGQKSWQRPHRTY